MTRGETLRKTYCAPSNYLAFVNLTSFALHDILGLVDFALHDQLMQSLLVTLHLAVLFNLCNSDIVLVP